MLPINSPKTSQILSRSAWRNGPKCQKRCLKTLKTLIKNVISVIANTEDYKKVLTWTFKKEKRTMRFSGFCSFFCPIVKVHLWWQFQASLIFLRGGTCIIDDLLNNSFFCQTNEPRKNCVCLSVWFLWTLLFS